ncbi:MAG TPA: hypothetical protein VIF81_04450 [Pyrinomonadaceae bacterium]|jgi:autotransporter-associated beta strand protein
MKRKSIFSVAVALSVLLTVITFVSTTQAQPPQRFVYTTGVVKLGPNQALRIIIDWGDGTAGQVRFGRTLYTQGPCNSDGVCQLTGSNTYTGLTTLEKGVVASCDVLAAGTYGRGLVVTTSQKVHVSAAIVNATTGATDVLIGPLLPENITLTEVLISRFDAKVTIVGRRTL